MARFFLVYWKREQIATAVADGLLDHAASEQLASVRPGDTLWVGGPGRSRDIVTIGPLRVGDVVGQREAERRLSYPPWQAKYHALCKPGEATVTREVSLGAVLDRLTFVSKKSPVLNLRKTVALQLQRIRELTPESAALLEQVWYQRVREVEAEFADLQAQLAQFENLDTKVPVLVRREQAFLRDFLFRGGALGKCVICGAVLPVEFLVAAHIKPRSNCSELERRDLTNVVPMCLLGCDALFERRVVAVADGKVVFRPPSILGHRLEALGRSLDGRRCLAWKPERQKYFAWHFAKT
jgi:hypothetical protein